MSPVSSHRRPLLTLAAAVVLCGLPAGRARADLVLTAAGQSEGFQLSTFATDFPSYNNIGPLGISFPAGDGVLVSDIYGTVRQFPNRGDGQSAGAARVGGNYGLEGAVGMAQVGDKTYLVQRSPSCLVELGPGGAILRTAAFLPPRSTGVVANPLTGRLYVSNEAGAIMDVDPRTGLVRPFATAAGDGLTTDGRTLYAATASGHVLGFDLLTGAQIFDSGFLPGGPDGTALGGGLLDGLLFANNNDGTVTQFNLATGVLTQIATGGSRGDFIAVAPDGSLLITQSDRVVRLTPPTGGVFGPSGGPGIPEPTTLLLFGLGLLGLGGMHLSRRVTGLTPPTGST